MPTALALVVAACMATAVRTPDVVVSCDAGGGTVYLQGLSTGVRASHSVGVRQGRPSMDVAQQARHRAIQDAAASRGYVLAHTQVVLQGTPPYYELMFVANGAP